MLFKKQFLPTLLFGFLLLSVGCNSKQQSEVQDTPAPKATEEEEATVEEPQPNTIGLPKQEIDFSKVQIADEKRFTEEVCEFDNGRYGFKCTRPTIIDFYADWCGPCVQISPYLVEFAEKYSDQIAIYKVNVDKCPNLANQFKIESIPALIFVKPNEKPQMIVGSMPKDKLEELIQDLLLK